MVVSLIRRLLGGKSAMSYEQARELAAHKDQAVRAELAGHSDLKPEILYFLAEDDSPEVRLKVAQSPHAPPQANLLLAQDKDEAVRHSLAAKLARLAPGLGANEQDRLRRLTYETLETLARDQAVKVREILADALKEVADAPPDVIRRLARDAELVVAGPVLQFSPVLTDDDLLEIIQSSPIPGALSAISKRSVVNSRVCDAIAATDDTDAIGSLLANPSAQIREETLDRLVDRAVDIESWHKPLVHRPHLTSRTAGKLARFVASNLLKSLAERGDLPPETAAAVAAVVRKRLDEIEGPAQAKQETRKAADESAAMARARDLHSLGKLDESTIDTALTGGDLGFVIASLALLSGLPVKTIKKASQHQSAKGIVAITWKAGLSTSMATQLQTKLLHLPSARILASREGSFPLSVDEMSWQLEFLGE